MSSMFLSKFNANSYFIGHTTIKKILAVNFLIVATVVYRP